MPLLPPEPLVPAIEVDPPAAGVPPEPAPAAALLPPEPVLPPLDLVVVPPVEDPPDAPADWAPPVEPPLPAPPVPLSLPPAPQYDNDKHREKHEITRMRLDRDMELLLRDKIGGAKVEVGRR
jgi:hypothetical protein